MNIRNILSRLKPKHSFNSTTSKNPDTSDEKIVDPIDYKKTKYTHQNVNKQFMSKKDQFIIFLDIDQTIFKGFNSVCHSPEYAKIFKEYHQEKGYDLPLIALPPGKSLENIDETILKNAQQTKIPILIRISDNSFCIYGDKIGDGKWGFTFVPSQYDLDFSKLPFDRKEITRYDELFNQALISILKNCHAQQKPFYSEYVYKGILRDYAEFKAQTHFFDEKSLSNLTNLIDVIEKRGMQVGIVISSAWREFFDTETLKILFGRLYFSKYIIDKIYDKAAFYIEEAVKSDLFLIELENNNELSFEDICLAQDKNIPILIKQNHEFSIYRCVAGNWMLTPLSHLSNAEQKKTLSELNFKVNFIKKDELSEALFEIIKIYHNPKYPPELNRAESIELFLRQNSNISQFIILDDCDDGLSELFPNNFIHCKNLFRKAEHQLSLRMVDELFTSPKDLSSQQVENRIIPSVKKTFDKSRACDERLLEISMRVLGRTRHSFLKSILQESRKSPFKDCPEITNTILDYEKEDFSKSFGKFGK